MTKTVKSWIEKAVTPQNIMAMLMAGFGLVLSYNHFKDNIETRVQRVEDFQKNYSNKLIGRKRFMIEAGDRIDHMCERMETCEKRFGPLQVPE